MKAEQEGITMKKLIILLTALMMCLPALAEALPEAQPTEPLTLSSFVFALPQDVQAAAADPDAATASLVHGNGSTRVVAMALSRVPDEEADHAAGLARLMELFAPGAQDLTPLTLTPGFHGLMAVTPYALEGAGTERVDQVTVMVLWQTALRGELLILSGYDMMGDTAKARTMIDMLLHACTVNDAPVLPAAQALPASTPEEELPLPGEAPAEDGTAPAQ